MEYMAARGPPDGIIIETGGVLTTVTLVILKLSRFPIGQGEKHLRYMYLLSCLITVSKIRIKR